MERGKTAINCGWRSCRGPPFSGMKITTDFLAAQGVRGRAQRRFTRKREGIDDYVSEIGLIIFACSIIVKQIRQSEWEITMTDRPDAAELDRLVAGYCVSQAIYVAAELGIADRLADGPRRAEELAAEIGAHTRSLYRLLRALASLGIFAEDETERFALTPMSELLLSDVPGSQRATVQMMVGQFYQAWGGLIESIRTGKPAFELMNGQSFFDHLADHQDQAQIFDSAMTARNDRKTKAMLDVYDFSGVQVLADIGGGNGSMLVTVLKRYPKMRGILFDRHGVIERAKAGIERAGVADRCEIVGGSFLGSVPGGADAYLLRHILHNWDDDRAPRS